MPASVDASHQNRSLGDEQLDDSIVDTLVSALANERLPFLRAYLREFGCCRRYRIEITVAGYPPSTNEKLSGRICSTVGRHWSIVRGKYGFSACT